MKSIYWQLNQKTEAIKRNIFILKLLSLFILFIPSTQAIDLVFGVESSTILSEPGGVYASSVNLAVTAEIQSTDTAFFNSNCTITGELLLTSTSANNAEDYLISSNTFSITTNSTDVANGQIFSSADNFLSILSDSQDEGVETLVVAMRSISILCNQNNVPVRNTQVLSIDIIDTEQQHEQPLESRDDLRAIGQGTLVSQVDDIKTFSLLSSATRTQGLSKQVRRSQKRTQTIDTSNLNISLNGVPLNCNLLPALCNYDLSHSYDNSNAYNSPDSSDDLISPLGYFAYGSIELGERKGENSDRVEFDSNLLSVGVDYRLDSKIILGTALSRSTTESGAKDRSSATDYEQYGLSVFGSYYFNSQYYIDVMASYGKADYDLRRKVAIGTLVGFASGDTDGKEINLAFGSGYTLNFDNMELRFSGILNYTEVTVDAYQEQSFGVIPTVAVDELNLEQVLTNVAADFTWNINASFGVVIPQISLGWEHHFEQDTLNVSGALSTDATADDFNYDSLAQDKDYLTWLLGVSTVLPHGATAYATFGGYAGRSDVKSNTAYIGFRLEF